LSSHSTDHCWNKIDLHEVEDLSLTPALSPGDHNELLSEQPFQRLLIAFPSINTWLQPGDTMRILSRQPFQRLLIALLLTE
jgi:hypothetical protein